MLGVTPFDDDDDDDDDVHDTSDVGDVTMMVPGLSANRNQIQ